MRVQALFLLGTTWLAVGCGTTLGSFETNAKFIPPNSNVTHLGTVSVSDTKVGWLFIGGRHSIEDVRELHREAMEQQADATALINYAEDTTLRGWPLLFRSSTYRLTGEAVRVEIGEQVE